MKPSFSTHLSLPFLLLCLLIAAACNSSNETREQVPKPVAQTTSTAKAPTHEEFKDMTPEERWRTFSPARRNYLRQNPDLYPYLKPYVLANPEMEEVPPATAPDPNQAPAFTQPQADFMNYTPEQWWNSFSPERKQHIREHPEWFPEFKDFLNKP